MTTLASNKLFADWADDGSLKKAFIASVKHLSGENKKLIAISDNHVCVLSPLTIAPINKSDIALLADGLKDLKSVVTDAVIEIKGATLNPDAESQS